MNNDENLYGQSNNNGVNNGLEEPLQEVTVETSVPEEPYPATEINSDINSIINESPINNEVQVIGEEPPVNNVNSNPLGGENPVSFPEAPTIAPAIAPDVTLTMGPTPAETPTVNSNPTIGPAMEPSPAPSVTPAMVNEPQPAANTGFEDVNKKSKLGIIIAIIVVLLIGAAGYFAYSKFFAKSPYENAITNAFQLLKSNNLNEPFKVTATMKIEGAAEDLEFLNNLSFDYSLAMDAKNSASSFTFNFNEKGSSLLDVLAYVKDDKAYIKAEKLIGKVIYVDNVNFKEMTNEEDINVLINAFEEAFLAALKDEKETTKDATLSIGGKSIDVTESVYTIDKNNVNRVTKNCVDSLLSNEEAIKALAKILDFEVSEVKDYLEDIKKEDNSYTDTVNNVSIYTKGFLKTFMGFALSEDNKEVMKYVVDGDNESFVVYFGEEDSKFTVEADGKNADIKLVISGQTIASGKITYTDDAATIVVEITDLCKITIDMKKESNVKVDTVDTTNAIGYSDLTDEDYETIMNNFNDIFEKSETFSILQSFMMGDETNSNDVDWDL